MTVPVPDESITANPGTSTVQGEVRYRNGQPAPSVVVTLVSERDGRIRRTVTGPAGNYSFLNLRTGDYRYDVEVDEKGYMPVRELVISCDMAPVSLFITLIPMNVYGSASLRGRKIPKQAQAEYAKGVAAMDKGNSKQAALHFVKAVGICPYYFDSYLKLAAADTNQHRFAEAQKMINRALRLSKRSSLAYAYYGYLRMEEGKLGQAKGEFSHAIRLNPSDWLAQLELGRVLLSEKQAKAAFPHLVVAHQLHPQLASVHLLYYDDLILLNKKSAALAELNDFLARFPNAPEAARLRRVRAPLEASIRSSRRQSSR